MIQVQAKPHTPHFRFPNITRVRSEIKVSLSASINLPVHALHPEGETPNKDKQTPPPEQAEKQRDNPITASQTARTNTTNVDRRRERRARQAGSPRNNESIMFELMPSQDQSAFRARARLSSAMLRNVLLTCGTL